MGTTTKVIKNLISKKRSFDLTKDARKIFIDKFKKDLLQVILKDIECLKNNILLNSIKSMSMNDVIMNQFCEKNRNLIRKTVDRIKIFEDGCRTDMRFIIKKELDNMCKD